MYKNFSSLKARLLLGVTILISGIAFFETTAINVAIPAIQETFGANISLIQWAINSYNLMLGVFILIMGSLSDRFGHKKLLLTGLVLFTVGSALCGYSINIWMLIIARVIQGLGGAMIIPQSVAIINSSFSKDIRGKALGIWGAVSGLMSVAGPFFSGIIVDTSRWENIFLILVPLGLIAMVLVYKIVPDTKVLSSNQLHWGSVSLLGFGLFGMSYALIQSSSQKWEDPIILTALVLGIVLFGLFIWSQMHMKVPLINLKVLSRNVILANIYTLFLYGIISSLAFYGVMFFQEVAGYSATQSGLALMPVSILIAGMAIGAGGIADKYGTRIPMAVGAAFVCIGLLLLLRTNENSRYVFDILPGMVFIGAGFGIFVPSLTKTALSVPVEFSGTASGINNAVSRIAGLLGIALLGTILSTSFNHYLQKKLVTFNLAPSISTSLKEQSNKLMQMDLGQLPDDLQSVIKKEMRSSFMNAYHLQLIICAVLAAGGTVTALLLKKED
jgi:EmrB/QacA subfamily drug resistance transporter